MRYIIDILSKEQQIMHALIRESKYNSVQEFIQTAIENQLYLEQHELEMPQHITNNNKTPVTNLDHNYLHIFPSEEVEVSEAPSVSKLYSDGPLWGLANRFFPIKITTRVLANMLRNDGQYLAFDDLADNSFMVACSLSKTLVKADMRARRKRGNRLSDALPSIRREKSRKRFKSQFVGGVIHSTNKIFGAPSQLQFINIVGDVKSLQIGITRAGLDFALLNNPLIDRQDYHGNALSFEESRFLVQHIYGSVPGEAQGISLLLAEISKGNSKSTQFDDVLKSTFKYNNTMATTVRVGLIGRMAELDLIKRKKSGVSVRFGLTRFGDDTLRKFSEPYLQQTGVKA